MSLKPFAPEQIQSTAQIVLAYLDDPANNTPNNMLEGIVSGKSLLRGIVSGQLVVCQTQPEAPAAPPVRVKKTPEESDEISAEVEVEGEEAA